MISHGLGTGAIVSYSLGGWSPPVAERTAEASHCAPVMQAMAFRPIISTNAQLADAFGIVLSSISMIVYRKTWKHVA